MIVGVVVLLIGILYLLEIFNPSFQLNFDIIWPIVLIVISIYYIIKDEKLDFTKILFLFIGLWFLLVNTSLIVEPYNKAFWPVILILIGGYIVISAIGKDKKNTKIKPSKHSKDYYGIFSEVKDNVKTKNFKGTDVYCIFGGAELDFREIELKSDAIINVYSFFGGATIRVSDNYNVICNSTAILGANENKTTNSSDDSKQNLIINCISFCGGTEIK